MAELTHPMIVDGWFREINDQWPGEAHTLKVKKILHVEQSQYQVRPGLTAPGKLSDE